jgi:transformation/transcription domain-associated protein
LKLDLFNECALKMVPDTVLTRVCSSHFITRHLILRSVQYMTKTMDGPMELWTMRKQFASQLATVSFMTYLFCIAGRNPSRFTVSRETGKIVMHELTPSKKP